MYRNSPDGICGNEDCGQMSAWYAMSAMGFYPVDPCGGEYELGIPLFPEVTLHLTNGKTFTVSSLFEHSEKPQQLYKDLKPSLNGKRVKGTTISHKDITKGGMLEFK